MTNRAKLLSSIATVAMALGTASTLQAQTTTTTATPTASPTAKPVKPVYRNVRAFYRNVRAFWGDVNPFYRNVRAFWGDVDPFYRNVRAFWGDLDPAVNAAAAGAPAYAGVGPFWEGVGTEWDGISSSWQTAGTYGPESAASYADVASRMRAMIASSKSFWGDAVIRQSGASSFEEGFSNEFLARYGIDLDDPSTLSQLPANEQSAFFVEWYDGLMAFSGTDHADWWMRSANWSPKLTQQQSAGKGAIIGLVDAFAVNSGDIQNRVTVLSPNIGSTSGHGEGVLSLINAPHDGVGAMGIAPAASVLAYNPFDATGGADWNSVETAIRAVVAKRPNGSRGATVVNLSLGVPGSTFNGAWRDLFNRSEISTYKDRMLFVIAAGNDGITQSGKVDMKGALDVTFIVVGAAGPDGVSDFSNRPGNTCLADGTDCKYSLSLKESGLLMHRFITAPGELILVSDGKGGLTRQSGTSLAAPLVSGTAALIQGRWPWLRDKPREVARIILGSARDVGAPGVDPIYGVGMLDVEGAMSPLNFNQLKYDLTTGTNKTEIKVDILRTVKVQPTWLASNAYFYAYEKLEESYRDFLIPLSSRLYGTTKDGNYFQDYVFTRMSNWLTTGDSKGRGFAGFSDSRQSGTIGAEDGWRMSMVGRTVQVPTGRGGDRRVELRSTMDVEAPSGDFGFSMGRGDGAVALAGSASLGLASDFDPYSGGANPLLGFASGGAHLGARVAVAPGLRVKFGVTEQQRALGADLFEVADVNDRVLLAGLERYRSNAANIGLEYRPANPVTLTASYTRLSEPNAILGVRSLARGELGGGTVTDGVTLGASVDTGLGIDVYGSATGSRSRSLTSNAALRIGAGGMLGTSFQVGVATKDVLGDNDTLRLSLAQPLRTEAGAIEVTGLQVVDRETGARAIRTDRFDVGGLGTRRLVAEGLYGTSVLGGRGELSLFGRGELREVDEGTPRLMLGTQLRLDW